MRMLEELSDGMLARLREQVGEVGRDRIDAELHRRRFIAPPAAPTRKPDRLVEQKGPKPRAMNEWERHYLEHLQARPDVAHAEFEGVRLKLAPGSWYKPDFLVRRQDGGIELHEVKGQWREAARVRIKVAARLHPQWTFTAVRRLRQRDGGGWTVESFDAD
jgi:hypothetical protein